MHNCSYRRVYKYKDRLFAVDYNCGCEGDDVVEHFELIELAPD